MQPTFHIPFVAKCIFAVLFFFPTLSFSQTAASHSKIVFNQLDASNGLSYNYINGLCLDKSGILWVSTGHGLNMFDGKTAVKFYSTEYPELRNNFIKHIICDDKNRLWVLTDNGNVCLIDEQRRFHKTGIYLNGHFAFTRWILKTKAYGAVLFTNKGFFSLRENAKIAAKDSLSGKHFSEIKINGNDSIQSGSYVQVEPFDDNNYILVRDYSFYRLNLETGSLQKFDFASLTYLTKWSTNEILAYHKLTQKLLVLNLTTQKITYPFENSVDQYGHKINAIFTNARKINSNQFLFTTLNDGAYLYNMGSKTMRSYRHDAFDNSSLADNRPFHIAVDSTGWTFLSTTGHGINYFKSNDIIGNQNIFRDTNGNTYNGYINGIATEDNDTYYLGTTEGAIRWKRSTNASSFLNLSQITKGRLRNDEVSFVAIDPLKRIWIAAINQGILVIDKNGRLIRHIKNDCTGNYCLKQKLIGYINAGADGFMWATGANGICRINFKTFQVDNFDDTPLTGLNATNCVNFFRPDSTSVLIATIGKGVWKYNFITRQLKIFSKENELLSNTVWAINQDKYKNLYIATDKGVNIFFANGKTKTLTTKDGLPATSTEALLYDKANRMWIGNDIALACYNINDSTLSVFDERYGLSAFGFVINSYHQNSDGELILSTPRGLQYLYPDELFKQNINLNASITKIESRNIISNITQDAKFNLNPVDNYVTFYFSSVDYNKIKRTFYEYMLVGIDKEWIKVMDENSVRYSSLPSGKYTFKLRVSNDSKTWKDAENSVSIVIAKPVMQQTWFKILAAALGLILIWMVINFYRNKQKEQQEELETQIVINHFASRINSYQTVDDVLWNVARNCISKLHFEDCVIYILDEEKNVLVQKAAYGPKQAKDFTIHQPIEIAVGKGIVGSVAATGHPELIANTELDDRYIVDDIRRYSEVAVPLIADNKVIGVIDSEHSRKNFFNQRHLNILTTIAVLCSNQIQRARAEEEKQKAKMEVLENKQKVAESRLQTLRLQMNPHFLFNALNSIQQMILANEELIATRYLSRFSKLLRAILIHGDKETATLKEELEILNLYVELEARRFKDSFHYTIECDEDIDIDEIKLPTLLIQPFVENAIWHGLMHKEGDRKLTIRFSETEDFLKCIIEDNGVGRRRSEETKKANGHRKGHISKGTQLSMERLKTLHNKKGAEGSLNIIDLYNEKGQPEGTRIEINFPVQN